MSALTQFRDHCRRMTRADHRPDCTRSKPRAPRWALADDASCMSLIDPGGPPLCTGCVLDGERALWARLADEVDHYLAGPVLPSEADHDPIDYDDPIDEYRQANRGA